MFSVKQLFNGELIHYLLLSLQCDSTVYFCFLVPAVDQLSNFTESPRLNSARSDQATSDEEQVINENLANSNHTSQTDHDFRIPITSIDYILSGDMPHAISSNKIPPDEPESCCSRPHTMKENPQAPVKSSPHCFFISDQTQINQQNDAFTGSKIQSTHTDCKSMYPIGDNSDSDSDSSTDSSIMVTKITGSRSPHEFFSDEEEVEICSPESQKPNASCNTHLIQTPNESPYFQTATSQNTDLDKTSDASLTLHCLQHSQFSEVFSTDKPRQSSNGKKPVSYTASHNNTAIDTCGKGKAHEVFHPGGFQIYSSHSSPDTHSATQGSTAVHADTSLSSNELKLKLKTSGLNASRSNTIVSTSIKNKEEVLECRTSSSLKKNWGLNHSDCPVWSNNFKFQAATQSRLDTSAPRLKGLHIKSKIKPKNETLQSTRSEIPFFLHENVTSSQSTKSPSTANRSLKANIQSNMSRCLSLPKVIDSMKVTAETGPSSDTLHTAQIAKGNDIPSGSKATAKSLDQLQPPPTQRTFIEVQLSCLSDSSSLLTCNELLNSISTQRGTDVELVPKIPPFTVEKSNVMVCKLLLSSLSSPKETHSATSNSLIPSTRVESSEILKSSVSRPHVKTIERRSVSTDTALSSNYNPFSVRHKIKSFENLANFEKPVIKNSDIQSYPLEHRPSINQRIAGYMGLVNSAGSEAQQRILSSYVENLITTTPCSPLLGKSLSSIALVNLDFPHSTCNTASPPEANTKFDIQKVPDGISPLNAQVMWKKQRKLPSNRVRQLRALSMPELEKVYIDDCTKISGGVGDKTEAGIHPAVKRATYTTNCPPGAIRTTVDVNLMRGSSPGSTAVTPQGNTETHEHQPGWSIRWGVRLRLSILVIGM